MKRRAQEFWDSLPGDVRVQKPKLSGVLTSIEQGAFNECFEGKSAKCLKMKDSKVIFERAHQCVRSNIE
jgi:hypothetical protein